MPVWFERFGGAVLSTTIDKYCYVTARPLPPFFDHRVRLAYSRIELVSELDEIQHPLIRAALERFKRTEIEIHYDADLPAWSGLGTSPALGGGLVGQRGGLGGRGHGSGGRVRAVGPAWWRERPSPPGALGDRHQV